MATNKGGRGKKAPYETTHCRIPLPLKGVIENIISLYKRKVENEENPSSAGLKDFASNLIVSDKEKLEEAEYINETALKRIKFLEGRLSKALSQYHQLSNLQNEAILILEQSKKLPANYGGRIKKEITKAIDILDSETWRVDDKVSVIMTSGVIIYDAVIASINFNDNSCEISVPTTESHFTASLHDLIRE